ncbi:hypothetical protein AVEN_267826-1 [Araneus ventricosus]|uniref:Uncharacterized protein n=1 Tax=Araneus ventricosus TaxID=182803 RepID=A0A4Y2D3F4_ARAVE|nr:hypothetical protein AVEN_267826-1 [Araneus ventricosus]
MLTRLLCYSIVMFENLENQIVGGEQSNSNPRVDNIYPTDASECVSSVGQHQAISKFSFWDLWMTLASTVRSCTFKLNETVTTSDCVAKMETSNWEHFQSILNFKS